MHATDDQTHWYAIWTRSRHEQVVRDQLVSRNIDAFLPTVTRWSRWKDRRKRIDWPLFPGYCFAHFDAADRLMVLTCTGVVNIVSVEGKPAPVPDADVNSLRVLVTNTLAYDPCPLLHEGARVTVNGGPLSGVTGRLLRKDLKRATVVLSVDVIGQAVRVEIDASHVSPL
jgi:transcription antitermination factor NusG